MSTTRDVRWYRHRWNTDLSWRLILTIVPRIPWFLRPPIHFLVTLVCFTSMDDERRAARRNLGRVVCRGGPAGLLSAFRLFYNFSKFMVAYTDLPPYGRGGIEGRIQGRDATEALLRRLLDGGRGVIVLGMHLGQWDLALAHLASCGAPVTVVMRREDGEFARYAAAVRDAAGVRVAYAREDPWMMVDLLAALRRNEIVAMQGDRPYGGRTTSVSLFGAGTEIPAGPAELSRASGAPILPAVLVFEGHRRFRVLSVEPIDPAKEEAIPERVAAAMESLIARRPSQWFNFYDVWAGPAAGASATQEPASPSPMLEAASVRGGGAPPRTGEPVGRPGARGR